MTTADIKDLMLYGERINIEYKEAAGDLPKSLWDTINSDKVSRNILFDDKSVIKRMIILQ